MMTTYGIGKGERREAPIYISDEGFKKEDFVVPFHYKEWVDRVLIPHGLILDRTEKLAFDIRREYKQSEELHLICLLKGSRGFFNQLLHYLNKLHTYSAPESDIPPYMEHYVRVKSYHNDKSTNETTHPPKNVKVASLLEKRTSRSNGFLGDFVGFSVPDGFLVGFSLDYNELFRDMEHICILSETGKVKYARPSRSSSVAA